MDELKQFIEKYTSLPIDEWAQISACFKERVIEKDEVVLQEGKVCHHLYFVESGLLHFYINKDGNDITKFFTEAPYYSSQSLLKGTLRKSKPNLRQLYAKT